MGLGPSVNFSHVRLALLTRAWAVYKVKISSFTPSSSVALLILKKRREKPDRERERERERTAMAGSDAQKQLLTLIRDFASEKSQAGNLLSLYLIFIAAPSLAVFVLWNKSIFGSNNQSDDRTPSAIFPYFGLVM